MDRLNMDDLSLQFRGRMTTTDCNGRIYLPKDIREQIDVKPHTNIEIFVVGDDEGNEGLYIKLLDKKEN